MDDVHDSLFWVFNWSHCAVPDCQWDWRTAAAVRTDAGTPTKVALCVGPSSYKGQFYTPSST